MGYKLVPFVVDVFGAFGASASAMTDSLVRAWGARFGLPPPRAAPLVCCRLSLAVARGVAALLLRATSCLQARHLNCDDDPPETVDHAAAEVAASQAVHGGGADGDG
jgi:hypothetical protein